MPAGFNGGLISRKFFAWALMSTRVASVATDNTVCSEMAVKASVKVLESNGTVVDAAVTAMMCVRAVSPDSSGIGG